MQTALRRHAEILCTLARLDPARLTIGEQVDTPDKALTLVTGSVTTYLPLADLIDFEAERGRLGKELADTEAQIERGRNLLDGPFAQRAPANVVQREREKLAELEARALRLRERLAELACITREAEPAASAEKLADAGSATLRWKHPSSCPTPFLGCEIC